MLLARVEQVRPRGPGQWSARCPAHKDGGPSLSIKETDGGLVLVHCFAGCSVEAVLAAAGLDLAVLFPPKSADAGAGTSPRRRRLMTAGQALEVVQFECLLVWTAALNLANGHALTHDDLQRLDIAARRIQALAAEARG